MPSRLGYACLNMTLGKEGGFRSMIKKTWMEKGLEHASRLGVDNSVTLCRIIEWNNRFGVKVYRMSSDMFPWASEYRFEDLPDWLEIRSNLERAGKLARDGGQRLSFHPGQFNCLTSNSEKVIENCIRDLAIHGVLMDVIGMPRSPGAKINIHLGGSFGDRESAMDRWCSNWGRIPASVQSRLTIENDDKANLFSVSDIHRGIYSRLGVPIVMDFHHAKFRRSEGMSERDEFLMAASTWPEGIRPVTHYSESATKEGKDVNPTAHSDLVYDEIPDYGLEFDCVIEAKAKELAVFKQIRDWRNSEYLRSK